MHDIKALFRGMMLKSKESHIKIAGHSKCLAISFIRKRNVRCFAWNGKNITQKGRIIPYQAENVAFQVSKLLFQVISPKSEPFYGRIRDVKGVMVIQERR